MKSSTEFLTGSVARHMLCEEVKPFGMESGAIPKASITTSSNWHETQSGRFGRLNMKKVAGVHSGGWVSKHKKPGEWIEIDLGQEPAIVTRVATQGRDRHADWVTKYKLGYYNDLNELKFYREQGEEHKDKVNVICIRFHSGQTQRAYMYTL